MHDVFPAEITLNFSKTGVNFVVTRFNESHFVHSDYIEWGKSMWWNTDNCI